VRNIYAATLSIESGCVVVGEVKYIESLKAEPDVTFAYEPEKVKELPHAPI
jgi:cytoskeletal protein CcmA (bactofilin family)